MFLQLMLQFLIITEKCATAELMIETKNQDMLLFVHVTCCNCIILLHTNCFQACMTSLV